MMKKFRSVLIVFVLSAMLVLGLAACGTQMYTYTLNYANLNLSAGQTAQLAVSVDPSKEFTAAYESSDPAVATVTAEGLVSAVADGSAVITVTTDDVTLTCKVTVARTDVVWSLNYGAAIVGVGGTLKLQPSVVPEKQFTATYSSSDAAVATVSADGTITGVAAGSAVITADVGDTKLTCAVSVADGVQNYSYAINKTALDLYESAEDTVRLTVSPDRATEISYTSSDESVVTVDAGGKVIAVAAGEATIYAEADGQRFACSVYVRPMYVLSYTAAEMHTGETMQLTVTNAIDDSVATGVQFASDNAEIVSVDAGGFVTANAAGMAVVTANVAGRTLVCVITVR